MKITNADQKQLEALYEGIFDGLRGAINSMKRGHIPWVGEEGNTETYLEYWRSFTSNALKLIDNYDREVSGMVGELDALDGSPAKFAYERIMFLKEFLSKQAISPWKYDKFDCSLLQKHLEKQTAKKRQPAVEQQPEKAKKISSQNKAREKKALTPNPKKSN